MKIERYPVDMPITKQEFHDSGWREVLAAKKREGYSGMYFALSEAAKKAIDEGRLAQGKVLWLLSDACSMMLKPAKPSDPFGPLTVMGGRRSALIESPQVV